MFTSSVGMDCASRWFEFEWIERHDGAATRQSEDVFKISTRYAEVQCVGCQTFGMPLLLLFRDAFPTDVARRALRKTEFRREFMFAHMWRSARRLRVLEHSSVRARIECVWPWLLCIAYNQREYTGDIPNTVRIAAYLLVALTPPHKMHAQQILGHHEYEMQNIKQRPASVCIVNLNITRWYVR